MCPVRATTTPILCSAGKFCEEGAATELWCPPGTYRSSLGAESEDDCLLCDAGHTCAGASTSAREAVCPAGSSAARGSASCAQCSAGKHQSSPGQAACEPGEIRIPAARSTSRPHRPCKLEPPSAPIPVPTLILPVPHSHPYPRLQALNHGLFPSLPYPLVACPEWSQVWSAPKVIGALWGRPSRCRACAERSLL